MTLAALHDRFVSPLTVLWRHSFSICGLFFDCRVWCKEISTLCAFAVVSLLSSAKQASIGYRISLPTTCFRPICLHRRVSGFRYKYRPGLSQFRREPVEFNVRQTLACLRFRLSMQIDGELLLSTALPNLFCIHTEKPFFSIFTAPPNSSSRLARQSLSFR